MEPPYKAVGERLKKAREDAGLTQQQLATTVGLSQKQISTLEGGHSLPMAANLPLLARAVGRTIDWLLTGERGTGRAGVPLDNTHERPARRSRPKRKGA